MGMRLLAGGCLPGLPACLACLPACLRVGLRGIGGGKGKGLCLERGFFAALQAQRVFL